VHAFLSGKNAKPEYLIQRAHPLAASLLCMALRRAPSAWSRARTRAAKSCRVRGSHFPALFDYFNLERKFV